MKSNKPMTKLALASIMAALSANSMAAFNSGSTGANGALLITTSGTTTIDLPPDGVLNYTTVTINAGASVIFKRNAANTPVTLLASGDVTIAGSITISGSNVDTSQQGGKGGPGGFDGGRGGSFIDASQWKANGEPTFNAGSPGFGPGGGAGGGVVLPGPSGMTSSSTVPFLRHGTGGAYGGRLAAFPASSVKCAHPEVPGYGNVNLMPLMGGSGGGGGAGGNRAPGGGGGGGGGAILIASSGVINLTGGIYANGGNASTSFSGASEGGAGSGGAVRLVANIIRGNGAITATGGSHNGTGGSGNAAAAGDSPFGICQSPDTGWTYAGPGRIRLEAAIMERTAGTNPTFTYDLPSAIVVPGGTPGITIASIGGKPVPDNPTGYGDLSFDEPGNQSVVINTTGVPVGSIVTLSVAQAGLATATKIVGAPTTGTKASATTSIDVALTGGSNTIQAAITFTVGGQAAAALAPLAGNENVAQVRLESVLGAGQQLATLITVSGKEYKVPAASLAGI